MPARNKDRRAPVDAVVLPGVYQWVRECYFARAERGDPRLLDVADTGAQGRAERDSPPIVQDRRMVSRMDRREPIIVTTRRLDWFPGVAGVDAPWLKDPRGGIVVRANDSVSPAPPGSIIRP